MVEEKQFMGLTFVSKMHYARNRMQYAPSLSSVRRRTFSSRLFQWIFRSEIESMKDDTITKFKKQSVIDIMDKRRANAAVNQAITHVEKVDESVGKRFRKQYRDQTFSNID